VVCVDRRIQFFSLGNKLGMGICRAADVDILASYQVLFAVSWVMLVVVFFMTIFRRNFEKLYVSLWYSMGALIWTPSQSLLAISF